MKTRFIGPIVLVDMATPNKKELSQILMSIAKLIESTPNRQVSVRLYVYVSDS